MDTKEMVLFKIIQKNNEYKIQIRVRREVLFRFQRKRQIPTQLETAGEFTCKFNERVGWTEDNLNCCRKILQPLNVVKFMYLYNSWYLIYLNNKIHKVQITEFISNVFIVSDGQDRY